MTTYVLVHGGWGGAHGWRPIRSRLRAAGHDVYTPSLTGLGERSHLTGPQVTLSTHIADVVNLILFEDLTDFVLVGHSYGGMVITGALELIGDRVSDLVYLDAFVPRDGEALVDLRGAPLPGTLLGPGGDWEVAPQKRDIDDPQLAQWTHARRVPMSRRCFTETVAVPRPLEEYPFTRTYIKATADPPPHHFWDVAAHARQSPAWRHREVDTGHMVSENRPDELAALLLELA